MEVTVTQPRFRPIVPSTRAMILRSTILLLQAVTLHGCIWLAVYEDDSLGIIAGKVAVRTALVISTFSISEMGMAIVKGIHEDGPWPVTEGFFTPETIPSQRLVYMVSGTHPAAVSRVTEWIQREGHLVLVVEHNRVIGIVGEQGVRLSQPTSMLDVVEVGQLVGADRIVFVEVTQREEKFGPNPNSSQGWSQGTWYYTSAHTQAIQVSEKKVLWDVTARGDRITGSAEYAIQLLTDLAIERATCQTKQWYTWMDRRPWRKGGGCLAPEWYPEKHQQDGKIMAYLTKNKTVSIKGCTDPLIVYPDLSSVRSLLPPGKTEEEMSKGVVIDNPEICVLPVPEACHLTVMAAQDPTVGAEFRKCLVDGLRKRMTK